MRVLIIDDDPVVRHILSAMVNGYSPQFLPAGDSGVVLSTATCGREGIDAVSAAAVGELPDVIFLDLQLLDLTGFEVLTELKSSLGAKIPPVILMSAQPKTELERQNAACDWSLFLQKPFLPDQVVAAVKHALEKR